MKNEQNQTSRVRRGEAEENQVYASCLLQTMSRDTGIAFDEQILTSSTLALRTVNPHNSLCGRHCLHFTKETTEAQRGQLTYPESHSSKW